MYILCVSGMCLLGFSLSLSLKLNSYQFCRMFICVYTLVFCCLNFDFVGVFEVDFVIIAKLFNAKPSVFFLIPPMYANNETNEI